MSSKRAQGRIYISSDFHFCHENAMRYSDRYSQRFHNIQEYQSALMEHLASFVKPDDIFLFLGDLSLGPGKSVQVCKNLLSVLKCDNIHFIRGNHDKWLTNLDLYGMGFRSVRDYLLIDDLLICHYPLADAYGEFGQYKMHKFLWDMFYQNPVVRRVIHGHIHNAVLRGIEGVEYVNVSVDKDKDKFNVYEFKDIDYDKFKTMLKKSGVSKFKRSQKGKK